MSHLHYEGKVYFNEHLLLGKTVPALSLRSALREPFDFLSFSDTVDSSE